eukprot:scaffold98145_cov63-Phaeocystis_antarctica.AAC.1
MQANTEPTTAPSDDGAPASEESAQMKINKQLNYATPVRTPHDRRAPWAPCTGRSPNLVASGSLPFRGRGLQSRSWDGSWFGEASGEEARPKLPCARPPRRRRRILRRLPPARDRVKCGKQAGGGQPPRRVPAAVAAGDPGRQHPRANYRRRSPLDPGPIPVAAATVALAAATIGAGLA